MITPAIQFATDYANAAPSGFEKVAFHVALQHYLSMKKDVNHITKTKQDKTKTQQNKDGKNSLDIILKSDYDWSSTNIQKMLPVEQYLKLLQIAKNEFNIDMLTVDDIKQILNEKFRINKTINTISMTLMKKVGEFVDRIKIGNGYYYKITSNGENHLIDMEVSK